MLPRGRAGAFYPPVSYPAAFTSTLLSLLIMLASSWPYFTAFQRGQKGTFCDWLTYYADPLLLHIVAVACCATLIEGTLRATVESRFQRLLFALALPMLALMLMLVLTEFVLKPSFAIERPRNPLSAPWLMSKVEFISPDQADSAPSGRVTGQLFLFFLGLAYYRPLFHRGRTGSPKVSWLDHVVFGTLFFTVLLVAFSRVYRGFHTIFDVGLAAGVCCYLFWFLFTLAGALLRRTHENAIAGITAATALFLPYFFYFSQDAEWWGWILIAVVWMVGLTHLTSAKRVSAKEYLRDVDPRS